LVELPDVVNGKKKIMTESKQPHVNSQFMKMIDTPKNGMLSKVPEVTIYFWIIKVLCTTVGETASDFLNVNLGLGLTGTSIAMGICLVVVLIFQFRANKYIPIIYWLAVVLISIFGTLITDNLTDSLGVPLEVSTLVFTVALAITFAIWFAVEKTLSIHSILTRRRESFYWLAILFTFALGTGAGDLMAESLGLGYLVTGIIVCAVIATITISWRMGLDAVLAFWIVYILTRPLGASLGDYLSQSHEYGGMGFGASITSAIFLAAIFVVVIFLSHTHRDFIPSTSITDAAAEKPSVVIWQVVVVMAMLVIASGTGYYWRSSQLRIQAASVVTPNAPLGDLSAFRQITEDTLGFVRAGDMTRAKSRVGDLEFAWDNAEAKLRTMNKEKWTEMDDAIDEVLHKLRAVQQDPATCTKSLESLITVIDTLDQR
jgi:uncharacterized membrane-anchored protein